MRNMWISTKRITYIRFKTFAQKWQGKFDSGSIKHVCTIFVYVTECQQLICCYKHLLSVIPSPPSPLLLPTTTMIETTARRFFPGLSLFSSNSLSGIFVNLSLYRRITYLYGEQKSKQSNTDHITYITASRLAGKRHASKSWSEDEWRYISTDIHKRIEWKKYAQRAHINKNALSTGQFSILLFLVYPYPRLRHYTTVGID